MKKFYFKILTLLVVLLIVFITNNSPYSFFRLPTFLTDENIVGKKYSVLNILNSSKKKNIEIIVNDFLSKKLYINKLNEEKVKILEHSLALKEKIEILDIYKQEDEVLVFVKFNIPQNIKAKRVFNQFLFILKDESIINILF